MSEGKEHPEEDLRHIAGYIVTVREQLRMQNWNVIVHRTIYEDDSCHAHTWQAENHASINVEFSGGFFQETGEVIRDVIVHEFIHAQHRDVGELWDGVTLGNDDVPRAQARGWDVDFRKYMERFVSWATRMIAPQVTAYDPKAKYETDPTVALRGEHGA